MEDEKTPISPGTQMVMSDETQSRPKSDGIGKCKILYRSKDRIIALGPDYTFFVPAFSMFLIAAIALFRTGFTCSDSTLFKVITSLISILQPVSYLACALSDPGVITKSTVSKQLANPSTANENCGRMNVRYCKHCNIYVERSTRHCMDCELCIEGHDHHCPWVSKCIGKYNLKHFYFFVTVTPIFILYSIVVMCVCFALSYEEERAKGLGK